MFHALFRICMSAFVLDFAVMVGITATPFFVMDQLGGGAAMLGIFGGAQAAAYAVACLVSSRVVGQTRSGLNWALVGVAVFAVFYCLMPVSRNAYFCCIVSTVANGALALFWPAVHSWVGSEPDPPVRARGMSWFNLSWSFGFALSPLLAGPLYDQDYRLPFVALFLFAAVTFFLVWSLPHERAYFGVASQELLDAREEHDRASEAYLHFAWCGTLVANVLAGVTRSVYAERVSDLVATGQLRLLFEEVPPAFLQGAPATKFSWLAFSLAISTAVTFLVMGRTHGWRHRFQLLFWLQVASGGAFVVLGHTRSLLAMALCFAIVGANLGVAFFSSVYYSMADPQHKHRRAAINEGAVGIGGFASVVFGLAIWKYGFALPFHYTPVLIAIAILIQAVLLHRGKRRLQVR